MEQKKGGNINKKCIKKAMIMDTNDFWNNVKGKKNEEVLIKEVLEYMK